MNKEMETQTDIGIKFENFLRSHRIPTGNPNKDLITHVEMSSIKGSYKIIGTEYEEFVDLYYDFIVSGNEIGMIEKHNGKRVGPVICDFDIRTANKNRSYSSEHIESIINIYNEIITTLFNVDENDLQAFVFEKDEPTKDINKKGDFEGTYKDGFHIIWPYVPLFVEYRCLLYDLCVKKIKSEDVFANINTLETIEKICDPSVIFSNGMMMFGSAKAGRNPYFLSEVYNYDMTTQNVEEYDPKSILDIHLLRTYDDEASIQLKDEEKFINDCYKCARKYNYRELHIDNKFLLEEESTVNQNPTTAKKSDDLKALLKDKKQVMTGRCTCCGDQISQPDKSINVEYIRNLINCLSRKRCNDYQDWIRVGWALQNIWHGFLPDYIQFSKKSPKFENGECENQWRYAKEKGYGYALPSLIKWAKSDNPELYLEISKELLADLIKKASTNTHDDFANLIYEMYKTSYVCVDITKNIWYEFQDHRWVNVPEAYTLSEKISSEIIEKILNAKNSLARSDDDGFENDELNKHIAKLRATYSKLKDINNKGSIIKACRNKFYNPKFLNLIDSNGKLIGFENGVFDLRNMEFRDGIPEDYITLTTGYKYQKFNKEDKIIRDMEKFFEKVQPEKECRDYLLTFIALCLDGELSLQEFNFWPGSGGNGKSKTLDLIKFAFGEYQKPLPVKVLTGPTPDPQSASPALADKRGVRFVHSSEPGKGEVLNISTMKLFTGGDEIATRNLYEKTFYFKPQFKMVFVLNDLVDIPSLDGGTWRRIVLMTYPSKFKKNPNPNKQFEFEAEPVEKMDAKIKSWKEAFMWYLLNIVMTNYIEAEKKKEGSGFVKPKRVIEDTDNYHKQCDKYYEFIHENCIKTDEDKTESINILYDNYKCWYKNAYMSRPENLNNFKEYLVTNEYKVLQNKSVAGLVLKENME